MDADLVEFSQHIESISRAQIIQTNTGDNILSVPAGRELFSLKKFEDERRLVPERMKGTATVTDLPSFTDLVIRNKPKDSTVSTGGENPELITLTASAALFAQDGSQPKLIAVLNYGQPGDPQFGDHRVVYPFPVSKEWKAWIENDGKKMSQADFAIFLEDRIVDVVEPPDMSPGLVDVTNPIVQFARTVGGAFASAQKLLELSRGMALSANTKAAQAVNLGTGEARITFEESHTDDKGKPLLVPSMFVIAIPVFENGLCYRIGARLRYRLSEGKVSWFYQLYRYDLSFRDAFREACSSASAATGLQLFYGTPEAVHVPG